jgi:tRNA (cytidine/uridine-2'-O-)-methyltransferase
VLHIALFEPEIPPNTGNIARLCAATGTRLHLIGRLGFRLDDKSLQRAGLDYWDAVDVVRHVTFEEFERSFTGRLWLVETPAVRLYTQVEYQDGDGLLFGSESKGLPPGLRERLSEQVIGIPMPSGRVRSLNLATSAGITLYEAMRQIHAW